MNKEEVTRLFQPIFTRDQGIGADAKPKLHISEIFKSDYIEIEQADNHYWYDQLAVMPTYTWSAKAVI